MLRSWDLVSICLGIEFFPVKFIQGVLVGLGGLSMGREGPAVQLGVLFLVKLVQNSLNARGEEQIGNPVQLRVCQPLLHAPLTDTLFISKTRRVCSTDYLGNDRISRR